MNFLRDLKIILQNFRYDLIFFWVVFPVIFPAILCGLLVAVMISILTAK